MGSIGKEEVGAGLLILLVLYLISYIGFRCLYGDPKRFGNERRIVYDGTIEGKMVMGLERFYWPAMQVEEKITGDQVLFYVIVPPTIIH